MVCFGSLLDSKQGGSGEARDLLCLVLQFLADKTYESSLSEQQVRRLLVTTDLAEGDGAGAVAVGLPAAVDGGPAGRPGGNVPALLGGEMLAGSLTSGGFACRLLRSGHDDAIVVHP